MRKIIKACIAVALVIIASCHLIIFAVEHVFYDAIHNVDKDGSRAKAMLEASEEAQRRDDLRESLYGSDFSVWSGKVVRVIDGDTLSVYKHSDRKIERVRLWGIDAPEITQPFGKDAKRYLAGRISGKRVDIVEIGGKRDRYGRTVAVVEVDGESLNSELVREGWAWVYPRYCVGPVRAVWDSLEAEARSARRGLWSLDAPVAPWEWRKDGNKGLTKGKQ